MRETDARIHAFRNNMDDRVKPGNVAQSANIRRAASIGS